MQEYRSIGPSLFAEETLIAAILDGTYPVGSVLPNQRDLSVQLNISRSSLREALQRLERDGWVRIRHGKSSVVRDIWREGGLNLLDAIVKHRRFIPKNFIVNLLEVRSVIAPVYARLAIKNAPDAVCSLLDEGMNLDESPQIFASFDWKLNHQLAVLSENPIYPLLLNGFAGFYVEMARKYFAATEGLTKSKLFYAELRNAVEQKDIFVAEQIVRDAMQKSMEIWQQIEKVQSG